MAEYFMLEFELLQVYYQEILKQYHFSRKEMVIQFEARHSQNKIKGSVSVIF